MKIKPITVAVMRALGEIAGRYQERRRLERCCSACRVASKGY